MTSFLQRLLRALASLRLTVFSLGCAMALVIAGTLSQVDLGLYESQKRYFESFWVMVSLGGMSLPVFPGGFTIGVLLLLNLICAHGMRFRLGWSKGGIHLIHGGLIFLLSGQLATTLISVESQMRLDEGETKSYSEDLRKTELVVIDSSPQEKDGVMSIPDSLLEGGAVFQHPKIPLVLTVKQYYPNARLTMRKATSTEAPLATNGMGRAIDIQEAPLAAKMDERNLPVVLVEIRTTEGVQGVWLFSNALGELQEVKSGGKTYHLALRQRRYYKPFTLTLLDFKHETHLGTDIPSHFSSRMRLVESGRKESREVLITMNHPLRYGGETYFQASFDNGDKTSILQVVRNPFWIFPYVTSSIIAMGMIWQFGAQLAKSRSSKGGL